MVFSIRQVVGLLLMLLMSTEALAYDFEVDGLCYNKLSSNQVEVTYKKEEGNSYSGILAIPEKVKYNGNVYVVTSIGSYAFWQCSNLTSITIPVSVTTIGNMAFQGCSGLTSITIPNSVKSIGSYVFAYCSGLTSITISNSLANIGSYAFLRCRGLNSITIPNSVTSIGSSAFVDCSSLTSIKIPNNVTAIGSNVFGGCNRLTSISVGSGNTKYDSRNNCNAIIETLSNTLIAGCKYTIIPNNVTTIGSYAFWQCSNLTSITIPVSVTTIGNMAFYLCSGLTSIIIPNSVTAIGESAFAWCRGLISVKSYIANPYNITDVFEHSTSLVQLQVPKGTKSKYEALSGWAKYFKEIVEFDESPTTYTLSITASGNGSASYGGSTIRGKTSSFTVNAGSSATITFTPDNGYRIKNVKVNNTTVSVSNNQYTVSNINANTTVSVEFEAIPPTTYTLSITASGNGSVSYGGTTIRSKTSSFTLNAGSSATIAFSPDNGYQIKNVKVNNSTVTVSDNQYTISSINANTTVSVEFEAIPVTYTLSITASGNGSASYDGTTIRSKTSSFTVNEGTTVKISITPDNGYRIKSVKENNTVVTSYVSNGIYTINSLSRNTTVEVEFEEILQTFSADDVNYTVVSVDERTIRLAKGSYGITLEVPAKVNYQNVEWTVKGIDNGALANNPDLAAIVWNPDVAFTEQVSNPNLLLYVNQTQYAPSSIKNVVVNGNANSITLTDAASGNNFYCPQAFTAQKINYTHNYGMQTGIGEAKGWETIVLPFDVQKVTHESKGEIVSFANWRSGDSRKPFWLMQLSGSGWTMAESIKANTPYIISMPNNQQYIAGFLLNGRVTFSAENVSVAKTENLSTTNYSDRTFVPTFSEIEKSNDVLPLNVVNDIERVTGGSTEGSTFERNLRPVHPFEAYMTSTSSTRSIGIDEGMMTGIIELTSALSDEGVLRIYNLNGQLIKIEEGRSMEEAMKNLPAGVYIVNGKKMIIR